MLFGCLINVVRSMSKTFFLVFFNLVHMTYSACLRPLLKSFQIPTLSQPGLLSNTSITDVDILQIKVLGTIYFEILTNYI